MGLVPWVRVRAFHAITIHRVGENGKRFRWYLDKAFISDRIRNSNHPYKMLRKSNFMLTKHAGYATVCALG